MAVGQPTVVLQGVETPNVSVDPESFFRYTRRLRFPMKSLTTFAGFGSTDSVSLRQTGVVSKLLVRVTGTITLAAATATTSEWPYNLIRAFRVAANGQSNLINASGLQVKMLNTMGNPALTSKGVTRAANQAAAAGTATAGTLSLASEDWGTFSATVNMGPAVTALTANAYTVDLYYEVPLAFDDKYLTGAIYAQTNATQLTLDIDWESTANLLSAGSTTANTLQYQVLGEVFSIPNVSGRYVVPDLSAFHSLIGFRQSGLGQGDNEVLLPGTGVGRQLMRLYAQVYSGTAPGAPLVNSAANFGAIGWRYGGNDTPEYVPNGYQLRYINELDYNDDIARIWGFFAYDFASAWAFRDAVDEGSTTDLRLLFNLVNAPTNGIARIVQETIFAAPVGA
jgi:hypothetical protein